MEAFRGIPENIIRIKIFGIGRVEITGEFIKAFSPGRAAGMFIAQIPFADQAGVIAGLFQDLRHGGFVRCQRHVKVGALLQLAGIPAKHQRRGGGRTRGGGGVIIREADALRGELVEIGRLEFRLAVTAQIAETESVALDENDARAARDGHRRGVGENEGQFCARGKARNRGQPNERAAKTIETIDVM